MKVVANGGDGTRYERDEQSVQEKSFSLLLDADPPPPSHSPIPFLQTGEEGCRQNKSLISKMMDTKPSLPLLLFMSASLFLPPSLYNHTTSSTDMSLITV